MRDAISSTENGRQRHPLARRRHAPREPTALRSRTTTRSMILIGRNPYGPPNLAQRKGMSALGAPLIPYKVAPSRTLSKLALEGRRDCRRILVRSLSPALSSLVSFKSPWIPLPIPFRRKKETASFRWCPPFFRPVLEEKDERLRSAPDDRICGVQGTDH